MRTLFLTTIIIAFFYFGWEGVKKGYDYALDEYVIPQIDKQESAYGEKMLAEILSSHKVIKNTLSNKAIDSIAMRLGKKDSLPRIFLVVNNEVNAFAMPGNTIIVYSGLIKKATNAEMIAGVLAHEIGHVKLQHVRKKILKEVGIGIAFSLVLGDSQGVITDLIRQLGSTAFDRNQETEADEYAANLLKNNKISIIPFVDFFTQLSESESSLQKNTTFLSTHPSSENRALRLENFALKHPFKAQKIMHTSWPTIQKTAI